MLDEPTQAELDGEEAAERGTAVDLPDLSATAPAPEKGAATRLLGRARSILVLAVAAAVALVAAPAAPAHAAAIKCRTAVTYNPRTNATTARVVNLSHNGTRAAVHSFRFLLSDGDDLRVRTFDRRTNRGRGYGPSMTISGYAFQAIGWQSGTQCTPGGVTNAG